MVQWLRPHTLNAGDLGFEPWSGNYVSYVTSKSSHAATKWRQTWCSQIRKINIFLKIQVLGYDGKKD